MVNYHFYNKLYELLNETGIKGYIQTLIDFDLDARMRKNGGDVDHKLIRAIRDLMVSSDGTINEDAINDIKQMFNEAHQRMREQSDMEYQRAMNRGGVSDSHRVRDAKRGKDVFTIEIFNDTQEEDITPMSLCVTYYDIDEAIADMEEEMQSYQGESDTIYGWVFAGEYETESGDVFGEHDIVYSVSNKD